jgi:succinate dehydrogenase flavin-adding protein (antitoxin of CptAB toxin-antitoxin module)
LVNLGRSIWAEGHTSIEEFTARAKELLSDVWDKVKDLILQAWNVVNNERGSFSTKKEYDVDEVNDLLSMAAKQDKALEISEAPSYDEIRKKAAQMAWEKINKKIDFKKRKENAALKRQGLDDARLLPAFQAINYVVEKGGFDKAKLLKDYGKETVNELSKCRIGLVKENGTVEHDVVADQLGYESGDDMINDILDWKGLNAKAEKQIKEFQYKFGDLITSGELDEFNELLMAEEEKIMNQLTAENRPKPARGLKTFIRQETGQVRPKDKMVTEYDALVEVFRKEAKIARQAFASGKKGELEKSKQKMRWLIKRRKSLKNVRDYFKLTDAEFMSVTHRRNPALMDNYEYKRFLSDVEQKAIELADNRQAKIELMMLIESNRLKKVDNYRQAMQLPTIDKMTTEQLREFAKLLEPFQEDDIFLTKRELETVDRTDLKGIKTIREALERLAKEAGVDVEELNKVKVAALDHFRYDAALRERDPFFDVLVTRMTEAKLGAALRSHDIESKVYELAKKAYKSRERGIFARMIPQDDLIMAFLEAQADRKAAIAEQMTPEEINYANFMQQYFSEALNYLIATKSLERGRENYFVHIRRSFLENLKDGGLKKAFSELFKTYQQDQIVFNILDDDTGNILPLEKFFQFSLQRTGTMEPTRNVTKAFLVYMHTFEKKKMFDAIIPKLDIYAQALTPIKYTPLGLEIDRSLKTFVNKWINNKKGRRISFDSVIGANVLILFDTATTSSPSVSYW